MDTPSIFKGSIIVTNFKIPVDQLRVRQALEDEDVDVSFFPPALDVFKFTETTPSFSRNSFEALNHIQVSHRRWRRRQRPTVWFEMKSVRKKLINCIQRRENSAEDICAFNSLGFGLSPVNPQMVENSNGATFQPSVNTKKALMRKENVDGNDSLQSNRSTSTVKAWKINLKKRLL